MIEYQKIISIWFLLSGSAAHPNSPPRPQPVQEEVCLQVQLGSENTRNRCLAWFLELVFHIKPDGHATFQKKTGLI